MSEVSRNQYIMKISIIVAMASNGIIGINHQMPWHLSADLRHFKKITMGKPIIMGRKTFESIGKVLPGRDNIIITHNTQYYQPDCIIYHSLEQLLNDCNKRYQEVMIIGGSSIYETLLPKADCMYMTLIHQAFDGDTLFPDYNPERWSEMSREDINDDQTVDFNYSFITLKRNICARTIAC